MMSFLQLVAEKKTSFLVGISNKFRPFLFCQSFIIPQLSMYLLHIFETKVNQAKIQQKLDDMKKLMILSKRL